MISRNRQELGSSVFSPEWLSRKEDGGYLTDKIVDIEWFESREFPIVDERAEITNVVADLPADKAGLNVGDVVLSLNGEGLSYLELSTKLQELDGNDGVLHVLGVDGVERDVVITPVWNKNSSRWAVGVLLDIANDSRLIDVRTERGVNVVTFSIDLGEGNIVPASVELGPDIEGEGNRKELLSYLLFYNDKDGYMREFDFLKFLNVTDSKCYYDTDIGKTQFLPDENIVEIASLFNYRALFSLAHEFRHAYQVYDKGEHLSIHPDTSLYTKRQYVDSFKIFPLRTLASSLVSAGIADNLYIAYQFLSYLGVDKDSLNINTEIASNVSVEDLLKMSSLALERDADYGVLVAFRKIKKDRGLDLNGIHPEHELVYEVKNDDDSFAMETQMSPRENMSLYSVGAHMKSIGFKRRAFFTLKTLFREFISNRNN